MKTIKKVAVINDISGIGRCSLTAAIPILSVLGVECCPIPTSILSNQTAFDTFTFLDLTEELEAYTKAILKLNGEFECVYSGFLGSLKQIEIVDSFIRGNKGSLIVIDPIMGDDGELYKTFDEEICEKIKSLVGLANIITPNLTEACILSGIEYSKEKTKEEILEIAKKLGDLGPDKIIITGVLIENDICNIFYEAKNKEIFINKIKYINQSYSGTGDLFTSIIIGLLLNNHSLEYSITKASEFLYSVIKYTFDKKTNPKEGILFQLFLKELILINERED